jgi:hypothetical protein
MTKYTPAVDLYMFICESHRGPVRVFIAAPSQEQAAAEIKRRGYAEHRFVKIWQPSAAPFASGRCRGCGYDLAALPTERGWTTCPECGQRQSLG